VSSFSLSFSWTVNSAAKFLPCDTCTRFGSSGDRWGCSLILSCVLTAKAMKGTQADICTNGCIQDLQKFTWLSASSTDTFLMVDNFSFCCLFFRAACHTCLRCLKMRQVNSLLHFLMAIKAYFFIWRNKSFSLILVHSFNSIFAQDSEFW